MNDYRRVFIIGAGASADAGMALGDVLLHEVIKTAESEQTTEKEFLQIIKNVKNRLAIIFPNLLKEDKYPNFEEYLNIVYDFSKGKNIGGAYLKNDLSALSDGVDKDTMILLYWYLYTACHRWAGRMSMEYIPDFVSAEVYLDKDAVISLNYDWLFERFLIKSLNHQVNPDTMRISCGTNVCDIASGNIDSIYGDASLYPFYKPHGSANWLIGEKGQMLINKGTGVINFVGDSKLKTLKDNENSKIIVYFSNDYLDYKELISNKLITAIIPPIGLKGYLGPSMICKLLGVKDTKNSEQYSIFEDLISDQVNGAVKSIHSLYEDGEIWLVGTKLYIDPYLYNQVILKKINNPKTKIVFIGPDEKTAEKFAEDFGEIFHYNDTLKNYSIQLKIKNANKSGRWNGLDLNKDFKLLKKGG
jgi:hypothetical protein